MATVKAAQAGQKGSKLSATHIAALRAGHKATVTGKPKSEEHKRRLAEANLGKKASDETRERMKASAKGRPLSEEARKASAAATKKRWERWRLANGRDKPVREITSRKEREALKRCG